MIATHHWVATLPDGREISVHSGSTDRDEIRGHVAMQMQVDVALVKVRKLT